MQEPWLHPDSWVTVFIPMLDFFLSQCFLKEVCPHFGWILMQDMHNINWLLFLRSIEIWEPFGSLCVFAVTLLSYLLREKKHHIVINNIIFIAICFIAIYQLVNGVTWCLQQPNTAVREMQSFESSFLWTLWSVNQTKYLSNQWKYHSNGDAATSRFTRHDVMPPRASIIF